MWLNLELTYLYLVERGPLNNELFKFMDYTEEKNVWYLSIR